MKMSLKIVSFSFLLFTFLHQTLATKRWTDQEETSEYWNNFARDSLAEVLKRKVNGKPAKNVILFLGDGMNLATMSAGRILKGQKSGQSGEETVSVLDQFENVGLSKVYAVDKQTPDSASTATAIMCGVKTKFKMVGVSGQASTSSCQSVMANKVDSILEVSAKEGKSTGIITTTQVQHASPASAYAHAPTRGWMSDANVPAALKAQGCKDIALQLFEMGTKLNVVLGGGRAYMTPIQDSDVEYSWRRGKRRDKRNLINEWISTMPSQTSKYVWNREQFNRINPAETDYLLGLFEPEYLEFEHARNKRQEPSLSELVTKAIEVLQKNDEGYFLFVEGGKIDHAHHHTQANVALNEFLAFEKAISTAINMTSLEDTLIVVTADHGHGFTFGGNADRGNPIHGLSQSTNSPDTARDNKFFTSIAYANGPGYQGSGLFSTVRRSPDSAQIETPDYRFQTAVPLGSETHSSEDVMILARGPMSHLLSGTFEQNYISHAMRYASCVGSNKMLCAQMSEENKAPKNYQNKLDSKSSEEPKCSPTDSEKKNKLQMKELFNEINERINEITASMEILKVLHQD